MKKILLILFIFFNVFLVAMESSFYVIEPVGNVACIFNSNKSFLAVSSISENFKLIESSNQHIEKTEFKNKRKIYYILTGENKISNLSESEKTKYSANTRVLKYTNEKIKTISDGIKNTDNVLLNAELATNHIIKEKILGIPMLSAPEIMAAEAGDCTEHSILCAAILRGAGLPTRAVVGAYLAQNFLDKKNVFVYHMWLEAYYKNKWVLVDATRPGIHYENRYIAFCYYELKNTMSEDYYSTVQNMNDLRVEIIDERSK